MIPNDDWYAAPADIHESWRRWARAHKARGGTTDSSTSFAAGWNARWTDAHTKAELRRLRTENAHLRAQLVALREMPHAQT